VWVARRVSPDKARAVRELGLAGVGLITEPRRFYPYKSLACHVLGFAGLDARGLEGLELEYGHALKGQRHTLTSLRDALGRTIHLTPAALTTLPEGNHLILTLDKGLQYQVEKVLAATVAEHRAAGGQAVVLDPATGEVLAMASVPAFNPNVFAEFPRETYRNRVVTDTFEPGSTFKTFVAAAALVSSRVSLEERFDCEQGEWKVGGRVIHDTHEYGELDLADILKLSSNIGAAKVGRRVGADTLYDTFKAFGFGRKTGVDLPGESRGILRPPGSWREVDLANICFGQGVAVTSLQLAAAFGAIANGGVLMRPYLVKAHTDRAARLVHEAQPQVVRRVMSSREAAILARMLARVTEEGGTGTQARLEGLATAGKTGTAQKVDPAGGYSHSDYVASFGGFVPAGAPKVVVLVMIDTPRGQHYGGVVAGPAFRAIARAALDSLGHAPGPAGLRQAAAPGDGPGPAPRAPRGDFPTVDPERSLALGLAPDLRGLTLREVLGFADRVRLQVRGWGRVVAQQPDPGLPVKASGLAVRLEPGGGA
jgi:cell division protein FtsI (penicillin-binding protein 3)